ncbi:hypothetical protein [Leifsonia sp. NPDC058248]|uniref:hypothetical protein n=1 Tax=Leifsonia sp. NPDC058248 TaxID=3346402 RepID=UPI0036DDFD75
MLSQDDVDARFGAIARHESRVVRGARAYLVGRALGVVIGIALGAVTLSGVILVGVAVWRSILGA